MSYPLHHYVTMSRGIKHHHYRLRHLNVADNHLTNRDNSFPQPAELAVKLFFPAQTV